PPWRVALAPAGAGGGVVPPPPWGAALRPPPGAAAAVRLVLEGLAGAKFSDLSLGALRFHLLGEGQLTAPLYEALLNNALQVQLRNPEASAQPPVVLAPGDALRPVGFEADEGLLPYPARSFAGYPLLMELFASPAKFLFCELAGLARACRAGFGRSLEVVIFLSRTSANLEQGVDATTFRTGCAPVVNLFEQVAEPIALTQAKHEYRIVP